MEADVNRPLPRTRGDRLAGAGMGPLLVRVCPDKGGSKKRALKEKKNGGKTVYLTVYLTVRCPFIYRVGVPSANARRVLRPREPPSRPFVETERKSKACPRSCCAAATLACSR